MAKRESIMTDRSWRLVQVIKQKLGGTATSAIIEAALSHYLHGYLRTQAEYQVPVEDQPSELLKGD